MGSAKTSLFTVTQNEIAQIAKVFSHPARVAILQRLFEIKGCVCGELVDEIGLAQSTISQHLKELKHLGLIRGDVEGPRTCYCINLDNWKKMKSILSDFLNQDRDADSGDTCC